MASKYRTILCILSAVILAELLSFLSFSSANLSPWIFGVVSIAAIILTVRRLEYGAALIFAELVIGSLGKMFVLELNGLDITIRMVLWFVVLAVWLARAIKNKRIAFIRSKLFKPYSALAFIIAWGAVFGMIRGNGLGAIFFDLNNYLYFLLVFPVYGVLRSSHARVRLTKIITICLAWISVKTIALFYIFSHEFFGLQEWLYDWSRFSRLAEITNIDPDILTSRIFMQSQIWIVFGLFAALACLFYKIPDFCKRHRIRGGKTKMQYWPSVLVVLSVAAIIASFSRSFWLSGLISVILLLGLLLFILKMCARRVLSFGVIAIGLVVIGIGLSVGVMRFPIPPSNASADLLKFRAAKFSGEAAVSSRYAQIRPLLEAISKHTVIGSGFGTFVAYESQDPRVLKNYPDGKYATTSFELGWLEIWLKIGLLGVIAYLYLLWRILKESWVQRKNYIIFGSLIGLVAVILTHGVSPYLNHPLGIGIVILMTSMVDRNKF